MKLYIAGKITGEPDYYEKFQRAVLKLRMDGHLVITPTILPDGLEHDEYMHICYSLIDIAEGVYFLDNWTDSKGAIEEYRYACHTGKKILFERVAVEKPVIA